MRPLVGELDESAGQHSGSSGERTRVDLGVSTETSVPSYPSLPPEASSHSAPVPGVTPHSQDQTLQNQTSPVDLGSERPTVFPDCDSFHPLMAEVTHNETADPSMIFHLPEHSVPDSPERQPASGEGSVSTPSEEFETNDDLPVESEPSPERLRAEEPPCSTTASPVLHQSFSQLITSQCHPHESVLVLSPTVRTDVELTALSLSSLTVSDHLPTVGMPQPEEADVDTNCTSEMNKDSVQFGDLCAGDLKSELDPNLRNASPVLHLIMEAASEKGILEQSEITLVSLTDTTLQDQETTITEEEDIWEDTNPDGVRVEGQRGQETEGAQSMLLLDETPEDKSQKHPESAMLLELQWDVGESIQEACQQKRRALLHRSSRRVEEIKAKAALAKIQPKIQVPAEASKQSKAKESQPVASKAKTKSDSQLKTKAKPKGGSAELHRPSDTTGSSNQKRQQHPLPVSDSRLKELEVKLCTPEQRKRDVSEMHQRTQRLYEQLEEVKHQKAVKSRQEANANNRLKAREFHKKTLQKLRAKQALQ
uniref:neurofilament medium polypeptide-like n=1 Tax=Semicossyphus pulcher TaxID=241346 RepID=UPI0037E7F921